MLSVATTATGDRVESLQAAAVTSKSGQNFRIAVRRCSRVSVTRSYSGLHERCCPVITATSLMTGSGSRMMPAAPLSSSGWQMKAKKIAFVP